MNPPASTAGARLDPWIGWTGRAGLALFALFNLVIFVLVYLNPEARSVVPIYREGSLGWWAGRDIFGSGTAGFIYLPTFAVLYTPFALLGPQFGDIAWRAVSAGLLALSIAEAFRLALPQFDRNARWILVGIALLIATPGAANSLRNGQATTILYALMLLATVAVAEGRSARGGWLLALAFALKPLAIVYILLVIVVHPRVLPGLAIALAVLLALPLVNPDPAHALELYRLGIDKVLAAGAPEAGRWSDLTGLLHRIGFAPSETALRALRIAAAAATLAVGLVAVRRSTPARGMLNLFALSVVYLMLMSPRTEAQTYLMLSATLAVHATLLWHGDGRKREAVFLIVLAVSLVASGLGTAMLRATDLWFDPFLCLIYLPFLIRECLWPKGQAAISRPGDGAGGT